ncbi:MAG: 4-hydroxybenzoate octaprenyltransferase [Acidiferrobacterales bacterium]|nr:4-hydroxybenzoate octaprenyltransferase [Acidiferrobacterales bacterium]
MLSERLGAYARLMRVDKPIGSLLLLWPTLWAAWIAGDGSPEPHIVLILVIGVFVMRSCGCVINDFADRDFDPHVERTQDRPLATGEVSVRQAMYLVALLTLISLVLVLFLNTLSILLAAAGLFLAASYPFLKRFTNLPQFYLGIAFGWGIPIAFAAHLDAVPLSGWLLLAANVAWAGAYDTFYAMVDRDDDMRIGVKSLAVLSGRRDRLTIGICQLLTLLILGLVGYIEQLDWYYYLGLSGASAVAVWHQYSCRANDRARFFAAFVGNGWFGAMVFGGLVLAYL